MKCQGINKFGFIWQTTKAAVALHWWRELWSHSAALLTISDLDILQIVLERENIKMLAEDMLLCHYKYEDVFLRQYYAQQ